MRPVALFSVLLLSMTGCSSSTSGKADSNSSGGGSGDGDGDGDGDGGGGTLGDGDGDGGTPGDGDGDSSGGSPGDGDGGDPCEPNPCEHGSCEENDDSYLCVCDDGYEGDHCEQDIDDCADEPCVNGTCVDAVDAFQCDCGDSGYAGNLCETLIQDCEQTPCLNGGICTDVGSSRTCDCTGTGATGTSCEVDINECSSNNGGCDALTSCTNTVGGFSCGACPDGYSGNGESGCNDINECSSNNGGCDVLTTCNNSVGSFSCGPCPNGFSGTGATGCINIDDCTDNPCKNGGTCNDGISAFTCDCPSPWSGSTCQNATLTINASARGFYTTWDWFPPSHGNTYTGRNGDGLYSSYFVFPLPDFTGSVNSVTLKLEHEYYDSPSSSEFVTVRDVSTPVSTLVNTTQAGEAAVAIQEDLSTGTTYGALGGWSAATVGSVRSFALSGAITAVSSARGASFPIGVSISLPQSGAAGIRFGYADEVRINQLEIVVVPE